MYYITPKFSINCETLNATKKQIVLRLTTLLSCSVFLQWCNANFTWKKCSYFLFNNLEIPEH